MDNLGTLTRLFRYIFDDYHEFANRFFFCKMHKQFRGILLCNPLCMKSVLRTPSILGELLYGNRRSGLIDQRIVICQGGNTQQQAY